jgi:hypothetical protein
VAVDFRALPRLAKATAKKIKHARFSILLHERDIPSMVGSM